MYSISLRNLLRLVLVAAMAGLALVAVAPGPATSAGVACQRAFSSGPVNLEIQDNHPFTVESRIDVPDDGLVVVDVDVTVNIRHPRPDDLTIFVTSATDSGTTRFFGSLMRHAVNVVGADLFGTVFDDAANASIASATAPHTGRFRPSDPLSNLNNFTGGRYELAVADITAPDGGTLNDWSVTLTYHSCDLDADGVEDHADQCRDLTARTATGCPSTRRKVTATFRAGKFRGALSSPVAGCKAGRAVTVFRKRPGPDRRVGAATTRADGSFRLSRAKKRGRYYAVSPLVAVPDRAECPAVKSSFRIR